jgi:N-acetyl-anhydromuramyl-L-alanine amidase AmpD
MFKISAEYRAKNLGRRRGASPEFIVLHDTAGNGALGDVKYLANDPEDRGVSVDFVIPKTGDIYQLNPDLAQFFTYHAGRKTNFRNYANAEVNRHSIGIEIGQTTKLPMSGPIYSSDQVHAVAVVCAMLCHTFDLDKSDITTHSKIIRDGSRSDPRQFPWNQFWMYFDNESIEQGNERLAQPTIHTVVQGETLYGLSVKYLTSVESIKALNPGDFDGPSTTIKPGQRLIVKE